MCDSNSNRTPHNSGCCPGNLHFLSQDGAASQVLATTGAFLTRGRHWTGQKLVRLTWLAGLMLGLLSCFPGTSWGQGIAPLTPPPTASSPPSMQRLRPSNWPPNAAEMVRIKDVTSIEGHRTNRVTGVGLVTGLKGTGGKSKLTRDAVSNMLRRFDYLTDEMPTGSAAVVMVTAEIPPFVRPGETVRATVSVVDDASGLFGGDLQSTQLKGYDGRVYAVAGGELVLSGFSASGAAASVSKNHDTTGNVDAQIEVGIEDDGPAFPEDHFRLLLINKDYATAYRIAEAINQIFPGHARARDLGGVDVLFPKSYLKRKLDFVVRINELRFKPDIPARVVINQKTGTIVVGKEVKLSRVMFANENLIISTNEAPVAAQPAPFSNGETQVLPRTSISATETSGAYNLLTQQPTVGDLAMLLNQLGVRPRDLIGIFRDIEASGSLQAKLIIQ